MLQFRRRFKRNQESGNGWSCATTVTDHVFRIKWIIHCSSFSVSQMSSRGHWTRRLRSTPVTPRPCTTLLWMWRRLRNPTSSSPICQASNPQTSRYRSPYNVADTALLPGFPLTISGHLSIWVLWSQNQQVSIMFFFSSSCAHSRLTALQEKHWRLSGATAWEEINSEKYAIPRSQRSRSSV